MKNLRRRKAVRPSQKVKGVSWADLTEQEEEKEGEDGSSVDNEELEVRGEEELEGNEIPGVSDGKADEERVDQATGNAVVEATRVLGNVPAQLPPSLTKFGDRCIGIVGNCNRGTSRQRQQQPQQHVSEPLGTQEQRPKIKGTLRRGMQKLRSCNCKKDGCNDDAEDEKDQEAKGTDKAVESGPRQQAPLSGNQYGSPPTGPARWALSDRLGPPGPLDHDRSKFDPNAQAQITQTGEEDFESGGELLAMREARRHGGYDVVELFSPPRVCESARRRGLK